MFSLFQSHKDKQCEKTESKIRELEVQLESMKRESAELYKLIGLTPEEMDKYLASEEHFLPDDWEEIQKRMTELDKQLNESLEKLRDPLDSFQRYTDTKGVQRSWLHCP